MSIFINRANVISITILFNEAIKKSIEESVAAGSEEIKKAAEEL